MDDPDYDYEDEKQWDDVEEQVVPQAIYIGGHYNLNNDYVVDVNVKGKEMFSEGDYVEVVGNLCGANQVGNKFSVSGYLNAFVRLEGSAYNFYEQDLKLCSIPKDRLVEREVKARRKHLSLQNKLEYLKSTGKDELEPEEFKDNMLDQLLSNANLSAEQKRERIRALYEN